VEDGDQFRELGGIPIVLNLLRSVINNIISHIISIAGRRGSMMLLMTRLVLNF